MAQELFLNHFIHNFSRWKQPWLSFQLTFSVQSAFNCLQSADEKRQLKIAAESGFAR